jgi:hypothetical protein
VGFFAQLKGSFTKKQYRYCTVFVDHFSQLHIMHLQIDNSVAETMLAKNFFEKFAFKHGVCILHYHGDNGQFLTMLGSNHARPATNNLLSVA